jgi:hypothetical protein
MQADKKREYDRRYRAERLEQRRAYDRQYYLTRRKALLAQRREALAADPEFRQRAHEAQARFRAKHSQRIRASRQASRLRHLEVRRAKERERARAYRVVHGERMRALQRERYAAKKNSCLPAQKANEPTPEGT